jgi:predicted MFS family arabinose efflux permease
MCPLATSYEQLALCVMAWGIGNSVLGSTPTAFMADVTDLNKRSQAFALLRTGGDLGLMIGAGKCRNGLEKLMVHVAASRLIRR